MPFAETKQGYQASGIGKFLRIVSGIPTVIQILDEHPTLTLGHWLTDGTGTRVKVNCLGPNVCPICIRNKQIGYNRDHPDYIPLQKRYRINVLNLSPVKKCPACGAVYTANVARCAADGCTQNLEEVKQEPLKVVQILERGPELMNKFNALESIPHPFTGESLPLQAYPIMLVANGAGKDMVITPLPQAPTGEDVGGYEKLSLDTDVKFTAEELSYLLKGGSYKDVLAAKRAAAETVPITEDAPPISF